MPLVVAVFAPEKRRETTEAQTDEEKVTFVVCLRDCFEEGGESVKGVLLMIVGVVLGAFGAGLFVKTLPPEEGSMQEQLDQLEFDYDALQRRYAAVSGDIERRKDGTGDRMRSVMGKILAGETVDPNEIAHAMKPLMRDISPLMSRISEIEAQDWADSKAGAFLRKYNLPKGKKAAVQAAFERAKIEDAERVRSVLQDERSTFTEIAKAMDNRQLELTDLSSELGNVLSGEQLKEYQDDLKARRVDYVQDDANRYLSRLDDIVGLTPTQHEDAFYLMVRSSPDYRAEMDVGGLTGERRPLNHRDRNNQLQRILTPEQEAQWQRTQMERFEKAEREFGRVGMSVPDGWDLLDNGGL